MNKLTVRNTFSQLTLQDYPQVVEFLWSKLRFREKNYFHSRLYKQKLWDGYTEFFKKKTGRFPTGLLPEVQEVLSHFGVQYEFEDRRELFPFGVSEVGLDFLQPHVQELRDYQADLINAAITHRRGIVYSPTGCHRAGQLILMYDGSFKKVEDIVVDDLLMGPDSTPRRVLRLNRGFGRMYQITPKRGLPFVVNSEHVLTLVRTCSHKNRYQGDLGGQIVDVTLGEYMTWSKWQKHLHKIFRVGVDFDQHANLPIPPRMLGLFLGDGSAHTPMITTADHEIRDEADAYAESRGLTLKNYSPNKSAPSYAMTGDQKGRGVINPIMEDLRALNLGGVICGDKFIPDCYKTASREDRMKLLSGLIDTDGTVDKTGYNITWKSERLAQDTAFVARSLGFYCNVSPCKKKSQSGKEGQYFRLSIYGDCTKIPSVIKPANQRKSNKDALRTGFDVEDLHTEEPYYGFTLDGDGRYLLEDFTVTHNSGKSFIIGGIVKALPPRCPILVLSNQKSLIKQIYDDLNDLDIENVGIIHGSKFKPNYITVSTVQSLHKISTLLPKVRALIVDEVHQNLSKRPKKFFDQMTGASVRIAVSATAFKFGGSDLVQKWSVKGYFGPVFTAKSAGGVVTTSELQDRDILSRSKCYFHPIREPQLPYAIYQDAITYGMAESLHFHDVVVRLASTLKGRTLIFVDRIALGDALARRIPGALWVSGKDNLDTRQEVIAQLKSAKGNVVAIATQQIFNAGINVMVHNVVNAAGGVAEHQIIQRMGRGLRTAGDKDLLTFHDFMFHINDYLLEHSRKRARILRSEGHEVTELETLTF